jgi:DNA-directed RNA polymerase specialized sigma24 family protein
MPTTISCKNAYYEPCRRGICGRNIYGPALTCRAANAIDKLIVQHGEEPGAKVRTFDLDEETHQVPRQDKCLELRDLDRALALLPEEQRTAILLVGLEGMDYETAAQVVGVPIGTVRSRLSRGREGLRRLMGIKPDSDAEAKMAKAA